MLAEMYSTPTTALAPYISWQPINSSSAKAIISVKGQQAEGVFTFSPDGIPLTSEAKRYYQNGKASRMEKWGTKILKTATLNHFLIPLQSKVYWELPEGKFH
jgi:hypothetical protein